MVLPVKYLIYRRQLGGEEDVLTGESELREQVSQGRGNLAVVAVHRRAVNCAIARTQGSFQGNTEAAIQVRI